MRCNYAMRSPKDTSPKEEGADTDGVDWDGAEREEGAVESDFRDRNWEKERKNGWKKEKERKNGVKSL